MRKIDIIRTSASAPQFLKLSTEALLKHLKFDGELRWIIHEDVLDKKCSDESIKYINDVGIYDVIKVDDPPIGQFLSLDWLLNQTNTPFILNLEDDYRLIKDIDLNKLYDIFENSNDVNQITFAKRPLMRKRPNFMKKMIIREGLNLVTQPYWGFPPAMWRMSYIKGKWEKSSRGDYHWRFQDKLRKGVKNPDADWVLKETKTFLLGSWKIEEMLIKNGGNLTQEEFDKLDNGFYMDNLGRCQSRREGYKGKLKIPPMPTPINDYNFRNMKWKP